VIGVDGLGPLADNTPANDGLDTDGDLQCNLGDTDDDGDTLLDVVETDTGVFVSASDTGTDPLLVDTDGDGWDDAEEVAFGSDPNDPLSNPGGPSVPMMPPAGGALVGLLLALAAHRQLQRHVRPR
jgi:hypothetical protein